MYVHWRGRPNRLLDQHVKVLRFLFYRVIDVCFVFPQFKSTDIRIHFYIVPKSYFLENKILIKKIPVDCNSKTNVQTLESVRRVTSHIIIKNWLR